MKIPYHFKVLTCPHIGIELDYCEVTKSLLDLLIIIYNKLYDNQALNQSIYSYIEKTDKEIMSRIIETITEDINELAKRLIYKQLGKINQEIKMPEEQKSSSLPAAGREGSATGGLASNAPGGDVGSEDEYILLSPSLNAHVNSASDSSNTPNMF